MKKFFIIVFSALTTTLSFNIPLWSSNNQQLPLAYYGTPHQKLLPKKGHFQVQAAARNGVQKAPYAHQYLKKYPYPQPTKKLANQKPLIKVTYPHALYPQPAKKTQQQFNYAGNLNSWVPVVPNAKPKNLPILEPKSYNPPFSYEFVIPTQQSYAKFRQKALSKNHRDDMTYEPFFEQIMTQPNDIPDVEREEHEKAPISYHEDPAEIPTKPIYPGEGLWAVPGVKHRPHITQHQFSPPLQEDAARPDGYEIFEEQFGNFLRQRGELDQQLNTFPQQLNLAYQQNLAQFPTPKPSYRPIPKVTTPRPVYYTEKYEDKYDDGSYDAKKYEDEFVPSRLYAQVRQTQSTKFLPRKPDEPRLREVVKDSKVATIYQEEGYEDLAYDHAGHEKKAESELNEENHKDIDDRAKGKLTVERKQDMAEDGSDYVEILKTMPGKKNDAKLIKMEQTKTTQVKDMGNGTMQLDILSEIKMLTQPDNKTSTQKFLQIIPKPTEETSNYISAYAAKKEHGDYSATNQESLIPSNNRQPVPPENYKNSVPPTEYVEPEQPEPTLAKNRKPVPPENYKESVLPINYEKSISLEKFEIKNQPIATKFYTAKQELIGPDAGSKSDTTPNLDADTKSESHLEPEIHTKFDERPEVRSRPEVDIVKFDTRPGVDTKYEPKFEFDPSPETYPKIEAYSTQGTHTHQPHEVFEGNGRVAHEIYEDIKDRFAPQTSGKTEFYEKEPKPETRKVDNDDEDSPKYYIVTNEPVPDHFVGDKKQGAIANRLLDRLPQRLPNHVPNPKPNEFPVREHIDLSDVPDRLPNQIPSLIPNQLQNQQSNQLANQLSSSELPPNQPPTPYLEYNDDVGNDRGAPEAYLAGLIHLPYSSKTSLRNLALPTPAHFYQTTYQDEPEDTAIPPTSAYQERMDYDIDDEAEAKPTNVTTLSDDDDANLEDNTQPAPQYQESGTVNKNTSAPFYPTPYEPNNEDKVPETSLDKVASPTKETLSVIPNPPPTLLDQTADEFFDATTESLDDARYAIDPAGQGEISVKFEKIKTRRKRQVGTPNTDDQTDDDQYEGETATETGVQAETETQTEVLTDADTQPPKLYLETDFVEKLKPIPVYDYPLEGTKYPFYHMPTVNPNSPLRYAQNPKHVPDKHYGNMAFYNQADKLQCEEVESDIDPVPDRVKEAEKNMSGGDAANLPETPRLSSLGDKIDCFKARYFGEDPFDNPIFKEKLVGTPQPIFSGLQNAIGSRRLSRAVRTNEDKNDLHDKNLVNTEDDVDDYFFFDFFEKRPKGDDSLPKIEEEEKKPKRKKNYKNTKYDNRSDDEAEYEDETSGEESKERSETVVKKVNQSEGSEEEEEESKPASAERQDTSKTEETSSAESANQENSEEETERPKQVVADRRNDDDATSGEETAAKEKEENTSKSADERDYDELINEEFKKFLSFPEDYENYEQVEKEGEKKYPVTDEGESVSYDDDEDEPKQASQTKIKKPSAQEQIKRYFDKSESGESDTEEPPKRKSSNVREEEETEESDEVEKSKATRLEKAFRRKDSDDESDKGSEEEPAQSRKETDEVDEDERQPEKEGDENAAAEVVDESAEVDDDEETASKENKHLQPKNIYDQIKILDDLYGVERKPSDKGAEKKEKEEDRRSKSYKSAPIGERFIDAMGAKNDSDEFRRTDYKIVQYEETQPDDESNESPEKRRNQPIREELTVRYESPVKKKLTQRIKSPSREEPTRRLATPRRYPPPRREPSRRDPPRREPEYVEETEEEEEPRRRNDYVERSEEVPEQTPIVRDGTILEENSAPPAPPPPVNQPYTQPRRHNYWKFPPKPYPTLEIFDITKFMPKPPYPLFIATPITIIPKYKTVSEVAYKENIKPNEQLNVFTDVIKTIKTSSQETLQAPQASNIEPVVALRPDGGDGGGRRQKIPRRKVHYNYTAETTLKSTKPSPSERGKTKFVLPENHKYSDEDPDDYTKESGQHSEEENISISVQDVYKVKKKRMPSSEYTPNDSSLEESKEPVSNEVIGLVPPPKHPDVYKPRLQQKPPLYQIPDESQVNNFYVIGMKPPAALNNPPVYSDYKLLSNHVKRRVKHKTKRRRVRRSAVKPTYSEISRNNKKPPEQSDEDDYVPHRPKNYHYDVEKHMIVYDGPKNYEFEDTTESVTVRSDTSRSVATTKRSIPNRAKDATTKLFPVVEPNKANAKNEPSYLDFVLKLKTDKSYVVIPDPTTTVKPKTTTAKVPATTVSHGSTTVPEFLSILSKLKTDSSYKVIEDKKKSATTTRTTTHVPIEEPEEELKDVQNAPGGPKVDVANNGDVYLVVDVTDSTPKPKNYRPKTVIDTSKYKSIERTPSRHNLSSKYLEDSQTTSPQAAPLIKSESSDNVEVVAQILSSSTTTTSTTTESADSAQKRRRFRGRNRHRPSSATVKTSQETTTRTPQETTTQKPFRRSRTTTEKFLDEAAADSPQKSVYRRHQLNPSDASIPPNHKKTFTPVVEKPTTKSPFRTQSRLERRRVKEVEVFEKFDPNHKHGGNYRKLDDQEAEKTDERRLTDVVPKPYAFYSDPKLPKFVNQLKEPNTPSNHEEIEEEIISYNNSRNKKIEDRIDRAAEEDVDDDSEEQKVTTKKPFFIKDPSKRFYYYAPV